MLPTVRTEPFCRRPNSTRWRRPRIRRTRPNCLPAITMSRSSRTGFPASFRNPGRCRQWGVETAPAIGACEVVVFAQEGAASFGELPLDRICLVLEVWADRTRALQHEKMAYVLPFENRGVEMGVTLLHPHGQ